MINKIPEANALLAEMDSVNHPSHYNIEGRKECIEEMLELFGVDAVKIFCELNAYKYRYRHELKGGEEDLKKADWYDDYREKLTEGMREIAEHYGYISQTRQLVEEMAELTQAICKEKRVDNIKDIGEVAKNLIEELADVKLVWDQVVYLADCRDEVEDVIERKIARTIKRMRKD